MASLASLLLLADSTVTCASAKNYGAGPYKGRQYKTLSIRHTPTQKKGTLGCPKTRKARCRRRYPDAHTVTHTRKSKPYGRALTHRLLPGFATKTITRAARRCPTAIHRYIKRRGPTSGAHANLSLSPGRTHARKRARQATSKRNHLQATQNLLQEGLNVVAGQALLPCQQQAQWLS